MKIKFLKLQKLAFISAALQVFIMNGFSQYKSFARTTEGDTVNAIDKKDLKQGKWILRVEPLRGEPGYEEEGIYKNGKKDGVWRVYNLTGDILALENYRNGGKDGTQRYFTMMGDLAREENWRAYNPDAPYDTIPIFGTGSNEILRYKIVKAEQYSVKHGTWKYFEPATGRLIKSETYNYGYLPKEPDADFAITDDKTKKVKPKEVLDFEKKNSKKKKVLLRQGQTGL